VIWVARETQTKGIGEEGIGVAVVEFEERAYLGYPETAGSAQTVNEDKHLMEL
jgi:hypothetical protein